MTNDKLDEIEDRLQAYIDTPTWRNTHVMSAEAIHFMDRAPFDIRNLVDEVRRLQRLLSVENKEILDRVRQIVEENGLPPASS